MAEQWKEYWLSPVNQCNEIENVFCTGNTYFVFILKKLKVLFKMFLKLFDFYTILQISLKGSSVLE